MSAITRTQPETETRLHQAAKRFGQIVAMGILDYAEAIDSLMSSAVRDGILPPELDDLDIRLSRTLADAAQKSELSASVAIREAIRPLISRRAKSAEIVGRAVQVGYHAMQPNQCCDIALEEIASALARMKNRHRA
jgi:hypothetical protein